MLCAAVLVTTGCGGPDWPEGGQVADQVQGEAYRVEAPGAGDETADEPAALTFPGEPRVAPVLLDRERRPALVLPAGSWSWRVTVPDQAWLQLGVGRVIDGSMAEAIEPADPTTEPRTEPPAVTSPGEVVPASVPGAGPAPEGEASPEEPPPSPPLRVTVTLEAEGGEREVLALARREAGGAGWLDLGADLSAWAGRSVTLHFDPDEVASRGAESLLAWAPVSLTRRVPSRPERPNLLVIVVDTLRHDHLISYGYDRETSPEIERLLAGPGVVVEDAYSQAPWTLPSVTSYMTSQQPGELLGTDVASYGIPEGVPTLAETLADLGYATGGFIGNPTLHFGNGFARGFDTFYSPEGLEAMQLHADAIQERAVPWIAAHQGEPWFAYVHYIDPHDPYQNPELVDGRSPWFEDPGGINGRWVHGVYAGKLELADLERDVAHLTALYDSEIRYVDRFIGQLIEGLAPAVLANTLVVLTSDHGEELYDHGGWKHGHTLYEDQIHVPLIFRWDGRIPAGTRLPGTVRLLDLAPTLVAAAGGEAPEEWRGIDLLPALTGEEPLPRLAAFAQHLTTGPLRAAAVFDGKKLQRFNREEGFVPPDELQAHIYQVDMGRLERQELYDLRQDPKEQRNLLAGAADGEPAASLGALEALDPLLWRGLDRSVADPVRLGALVRDLPPGSRLSGELTFETEPTALVPLFTGPEDRLDLSGATVRFELTGEALAKGFRVDGPVGRLLSARLALDGEALPASRIRLGSGTAYGGAEASAASFLLEGDAPRATGETGLWLWRRPRAVALPDTIDPETRESLRALGYIQ